MFHLKHLVHTLAKDFVKSKTKYFFSFFFFYNEVEIKGLGNKTTRGEYLYDLATRGES